MSKTYKPPYTLTPRMLRLLGDISEWIGRYSVLAESKLTPRLRRENRIKTVQASLAIENNTLSIEQVTAVLEGKRVLGLPREIQEVRNAFQAYEGLEHWNPASEEDLLSAHSLLMAGLVDDPGQFRQGGVGIFQGSQVVHMAPPAPRVPYLIKDLLQWLSETDEHALIASCVFHYEFEFIHPFSDGNGRMGRLWQTLILCRWKPLFAYLPIETVIHDHQAEYYKVLAEADAQANSTPFIEFMLNVIYSVIQAASDGKEVNHQASKQFSDSSDQLNDQNDLLNEQSDQVKNQSDQVSDQVKNQSDQVRRLLVLLSEGELKSVELMSRLGLTHRPTFRKNYLQPALAMGLIESTQPDAPNSPTQRYRLTGQGKRLAAHKIQK